MGEQISDFLLRLIQTSVPRAGVNIHVSLIISCRRPLDVLTNQKLAGVEGPARVYIKYKSELLLWA